MNNFKTIVDLLGGVPGIIAFGVKQITRGKTDLTADGIDQAADRMLTVNEHDHRAACARLGIKDEAVIVHLLGVGRIAGDKLGDYAAGMLEASAHITH